MRIIALITLTALIGIASADYVQYDNPVAKDLSNLNLSEIQAIFSNDGTGWIVSDSGGAGWTPSINAFLTDKGEGDPIGNVTKKAPLRCGGM